MRWCLGVRLSIGGRAYLPQRNPLQRLGLRLSSGLLMASDPSREGYCAPWQQRLPCSSFAPDRTECIAPPPSALPSVSASNSPGRIDPPGLSFAGLSAAVSRWWRVAAPGLSMDNARQLDSVSGPGDCPPAPPGVAPLPIRLPDRLPVSPALQPTSRDAPLPVLPVSAAHALRPLRRLPGAAPPIVRGRKGWERFVGGDERSWQAAPLSPLV